jgi:hypothetical protein
MGILKDVACVVLAVSQRFVAVDEGGLGWSMGNGPECFLFGNHLSDAKDRDLTEGYRGFVAAGSRAGRK